MIKNIRRLEPTESQIQMAIVEWANCIDSPYITLGFDWFPKKLGELLIKIPNEGKRSWFLCKKMKKEGMKKGVSDLFLAVPNNKKGFGGLWIEVKSLNGKISKDQENWLYFMNSLGYEGKIVRSVDEGIQAIKDYLGMK